MTREEFISGIPNSEWVDYLPVVMDRINKRTRKQNKQLQQKEKEKQEEKEEEKQEKERPIEVVLDEGTKVRVLLEMPIESVHMKRLAGKFRATDIRWNPEVRTIVQVIIKEGEPAKYVLNNPGTNQDTQIFTPKSKKPLTMDVEPIGYTRNQLQVVTKDEDYGDAKDILLNEKKLDTFIAEKILDKKKIKNKIHYLVKYRGFKEPSYQPKDEFIKNIHQRDLAASFEKSTLK